MSPAASAASPSALKVSTSPRPGSRMAVEIGVPAGLTQSSHEQAVEKLSRTIKLPGFRKGKVPRAVLVQQIGAVRIRATALEELVALDPEFTPEQRRFLDETMRDYRRAGLDLPAEQRARLDEIDEELNDQGYIIPGLGDAGDRIYGTL